MGDSRSLRGSVDWNIDYMWDVLENNVAPFVGVWIEICFVKPIHKRDRVAPFVGVWIEISSYCFRGNNIVSLPSWECGLKYCEKEVIDNDWRSLPSWECGLKSWSVRRNWKYQHSRSLRGSVDWNSKEELQSLGYLVAPFVGVWIEIYHYWYLRYYSESLPSWECGLK